MKKLEKEEVEIQKLKWQSKNDLKWEKLQWIRRTPQDDATAGNNVCHQGLDFEEYDHVEYIPKITPENPNSDCYRNEHGTRRGALLWSWESVFLNCSPFYSQSSCCSYLLQILLGEMTPVWNPAHLASWLWPLALLHSSGSITGTTREFRQRAEKIFPRKAEQDLIIASPFIHFLLVMH